MPIGVVRQNQSIDIARDFRSLFERNTYFSDAFFQVEKSFIPDIIPPIVRAKRRIDIRTPELGFGVAARIIDGNIKRLCLARLILVTHPERVSTVLRYINFSGYFTACGGRQSFCSPPTRSASATPLRMPGHILLPSRNRTFAADTGEIFRLKLYINWSWLDFLISGNGFNESC